MAGPYFKVQMFFGVGKWGWNEQFYYKAAGSQTLGAVLTDAKVLGAARKGLLSSDVELEAIRVSDLDTSIRPRQNVTNVTDIAPSTDIGGVQPALPAAPPWLCWLLRLDTIDRIGRRPMLIRGIPSEWYTFDPIHPVAVVLPGPALAALDVYRRAINGNNTGLTPWSIRVRLRTGNLVPKIDLTAVNYASTGDCTRFELTMAGDQTDIFPAGTRGHVYGFKAPGVRGLTKDWYVVRATYNGSTDETTILTSARPTCCTGTMIEPVTLGYAQAVIYDYLPIRYVTFERFVKRDTGRCFFGTRGALSGAACR